MAKVAGPVVVHLRKDLTRDIKRGHVWIYGDAIDRPAASSGSVAILLDRHGQKVASGIYDPRHPIPLRICRTAPPWELNSHWFQSTLLRALELRRLALPPKTTGYRLVNGEGDGLPGLVIDVYGDTAVIKLDGGAPQHFYDCDQVAQWLKANLDIHCVVHRPRQRGVEGQAILGQTPTEPIPFLENGLTYAADVIHGQKTGFFLDQRDNRALIRSLARDRSVLNLFSFSGGFSVAAGAGGCNHATSVDLAPAAIQAAEHHWLANGLAADKHTGVVSDVFEFLEQTGTQRQWDIVICDPPSFAPSERTKNAAEEAYQRLATLSARIVSPGGLLALASCSSHIDVATFEAVNLAGIGRARRCGTLIANRSLPADHPTPLAMPELRYLKFQLVRLL
ncbi:MAG: class I SAM-dependent rRNA methyltransferase [Pirellulaceae bacterium]|nr:class I SAM-dependent rRNA methyltransferase [Pirellulaceae bacterium]